VGWAAGACWLAQASASKALSDDELLETVAGATVTARAQSLFALVAVLLQVTMYFEARLHSGLLERPVLGSWSLLLVALVVAVGASCSGATRAARRASVQFLDLQERAVPR
jgi:hypothetical protein